MMTHSFANTYEDNERATSYADLEFPGTYSLAYRDLPAILRKHGSGTCGLDFGCGTGRSTRFLRDQGFASIGVDISETMIDKARLLDPAGDYRLLSNGDCSVLKGSRFDVILAVFPFDNIPNEEKRTIFRSLARLLRPEGTIVMLGSTPELYVHEWASFSTKDFASNFRAKNGDIVRTIMKDVADKRPVEDIFCTDGLYREIFAEAQLKVEAVYRPLAKKTELDPWISETTVAPWVIYVLEKTLPAKYDPFSVKGLA